MKIALNSLHWPVTVLGYGKRVGIWLQGCSIGCKGCCSKDTWKAGDTHRVDILSILAWINSLDAGEIGGFTISGGEPFEQPEELKALLVGIRALFPPTTKKDVLVYSGHRFATLENKHSAILSLCDAVISEPYVHTLGPGPLAGSKNQRIHVLSALGAERYGDVSGWDGQNGLQATFDGKDISIIGIPSPHELERFESKLAKAGILLGNASWRG